jgi:ketosteroid isomerase-like protein
MWGSRHPDAEEPRPGCGQPHGRRLPSLPVSDEATVLREERALQAAMLASDVSELDRLLHPELLAVGPDGRMIDKAGDVAAHRSGVFTIHELHEEEARVKVLGDAAVTFVVLRIRGAIGDSEVSGRMRYTRTWIREGKAWRVMAAHISPAG